MKRSHFGEDKNDNNNDFGNANQLYQQSQINRNYDDENSTDIRQSVMENFLKIPNEITVDMRQEFQIDDMMNTEELIYNPLGSSKRDQLVFFNASPIHTSNVFFLYDKYRNNNIEGKPGSPLINRFFQTTNNNSKPGSLPQLKSIEGPVNANFYEDLGGHSTIRDTSIGSNGSGSNKGYSMHVF